MHSHLAAGERYYGLPCAIPATPRVFLSYSRKDGLEFARRLQAMLEAEGLSLYRDLSDLEGGEDWWRQVETAIKSVEHVVLVLTPEVTSVTLRPRRMEAGAPGRQIRLAGLRTG